MSGTGIILLERSGRRPCGECGGDIGAACERCGGCGSIAPDTTCVCGRALERHGWHEPQPNAALSHADRLPRYFCPEGHQVAIRFLPVPESEAA